jgi:pyrroline-5-carboxylate reductase
VLDSYDYGVLGVGEIAGAIVTGLCEGVDSPPRILLSPRGHDRASALAARYPSVSVAPDNQSVADSCPVVVLSIRPQNADAILATINFHAEQTIVSVIAGISIVRLASLVAPASDLTRAIPLLSVAKRSGVTPVHPANDATEALFGRLGGAGVVKDENAFNAMSVASGTIAAYFHYLAAVSNWLSQHGVGPELASGYVSQIFAGAAESLDSGSLDGSLDLEAIARAHATPGGINERFAAKLTEAGTFGLIGQSLETILEQLRAAGM